MKSNPSPMVRWTCPKTFSLSQKGSISKGGTLFSFYYQKGTDHLEYHSRCQESDGNTL